MDNIFDNLSIINDEDNFQKNKKYSEEDQTKKNTDNSKRKITDEFDFEKSLELSNIIPKEQKARKNSLNDDNNIDLNLSLDCSLIKLKDNMLDIKQNVNENNNNIIRSVKTMPIKKLKKEDLDNIPLPIFSCIYCSNEYISFNHLSHEIISNKYLLQTSIWDMKQLDYLISFQPKIDKGDNTNKLLNIIINNSEYLKCIFKNDKIKDIFKSNTYKVQCLKNEYIIKKVLIQRFEDNFIRRKKDFYFRGIKGINKISKNSINNKCLFNSTNSWLNNYSGLTGFIANSQGQTQPLPLVEKNNNTVNGVNGSNSSICLNNNEIGLVGKGKNRHYMENIMENNDDRNLEGENTIEEKAQILNFICEDDLKRKITKNDIEWEENYFDIYDPIIDENILEENSFKEKYDITNKKKPKNKSFNQTLNINKNLDKSKPYYINSDGNINCINSYKNSMNFLFNNSKSLGSTNNSSNIMFKNSSRDKDIKHLSSFLNGNQIINIENNSTLSSNKYNENIKNKLISLSSVNKEKKLNKSNRTPSFTKTRIIDLTSNTENKLKSNNGRSCIDLKNIHKKILFNYTANIKKEVIDNNMTIKIKKVMHNNKRKILSENKNFYTLNQNLHQIQNTNNSNNSIINIDTTRNESYNKYNLLLTKTITNNDNIYSKTLFNKTNGFNKGKNIDNKKFNYNFNVLFKIKNNFEYSPLKPKTNHDTKKKLISKKYPLNMNLIEVDDIQNNSKKNRKLNINLRSLDKEIHNRKININHTKRNYNSAKKVNMSFPQKLFPEKRNIDKNKKMIKKENIISIDSNKV